MAWWLLLSGIVSLPVIGMIVVGPDLPLLLALSLYAGILAFSVLCVTGLVATRVRSLIEALGIERLIILHRTLGVCALGLVILHVITVILTDYRGLGIFLLWRQGKQVWAGVIATIALLLLITFALLRRIRRPRYEGWKMAHMLLAFTAMVAGGLHVLWLDQFWNNTEMQVAYGIVFATVVGATGKRWLYTPWRLRDKPYTVRSVESLPDNVIRLVLKAHGHPGFAFKAGQFAHLKIGSSPYVFEDHPFSMCSTALDVKSKEFMIKGLGDFSQLLVGLHVGRIVYLDGPYGRFTLERIHQTAGLVFIAGGVGVTPILSMLRTLADQGYPHKVTVLVVVSSLEHTMATDQIYALHDRLRMDRILLVRDQETDDLPVGWRGEAGVLRGAVLHRLLPEVGEEFHDYYVCGPERMVLSATELLRGRDIPMKRIHTEQFDVV